MGLFTLYSGLLLPWLGGTLWLAFAESRFEPNIHHNRFRQAGYGFFLGYAVLFIAIVASDALTGSVSWGGLMLFLAGFAGSGGLLMWQTHRSLSSVPAPPRGHKNTVLGILTLLVALWMAVHLVFIAIDIFSQPLYPWDAWLAWVYRAKAWYLAGGITPVVSPAAWVSASSPGIYTIDAWSYPLFPSIIPYWSALSLGSWSETLVNLPVLFAGIAIGMALYGQCREHGLGVRGSLFCCYLLYSIPLFATHIALAGYADIWMAGFSGLGFVAVIRALLIRAKNPGARYGSQMTLGFLMLALAILVKNEGVVWLLAALVFLLLNTCRTRVPILILTAVTVVTLLGFAVGVTHINIPLIGTLGVVDGRLVIPFIGNFALEVHNVWRVYWDNFFTMGSWNLFWLLVVASLILSMRSTTTPSSRQVQRIGLTFFSVFLATQLFIFGFTDQGLWADTFTAINRLPLHFVPALLFTTFIVLSTRYERVVGASSSAGRDYQAPLLAAGIVLLGMLLYLSKDLPAQTTNPQTYPATGLKFTFGSGQAQQEGMLVDGFANGYALLSSGPVSIQADTHPVLNYTWIPTGKPRETAFFWRQKGNASNVIRTEITAVGKRLIDLSMQAGWQGEINEFGYLVAGQEGETIEFGETTFRPDDLNTRLQLMWQSWTAFERRSQQSINFLQGGNAYPRVPLPLLLLAWWLVAILLLRLLPKNPHGHSLFVLAAVLFLAGWVLLDIRWTSNSFKQAQLSLQSDINTRLDSEIYQYVQRLRADVLGDETLRILITGDENANTYYQLRAKYHLLPHSVDVVGYLAKQQRPDSLDYVIFFGQPGGITKLRGWGPVWQRALTEVDHSSWGTVYKTK